MHAYHYLFVKSGTKTGLRAIALCRKDIVTVGHLAKNGDQADKSTKFDL